MSAYEVKKLSAIPEVAAPLQAGDRLYGVFSGASGPLTLGRLSTHVATVIGAELTALEQSAVAASAEAVEAVSTAAGYSQSAVDAVAQMEGWAGIGRRKAIAGVRQYSSITNPSTRYTDTASTPDEYGFSLDQVHPGIMLTGRTYSMQITAGQAVQVIGTLSGDGFGSHSAVVIAFCPTLGADNSALPAGTIAYVWRSNGSVTAYGSDGITAQSTYAAAGSGIPVFVAGDTVSIKVSRAKTGSGGTISLIVNNGTETILTVATLPAAGYFIHAGMRASPGSSQHAIGVISTVQTIRQIVSTTTKLPVTATPIRWRGNWRRDAVYDVNDVTTAGDGRAYECFAPNSGISPLGSSCAYWRLHAGVWPPPALPDLIARSVPAPLASYPFSLASSYDGTPATAMMAESVVDTFYRIYAARITGSAVFVDPVGGNDSYPGNEDQPVKSLATAMTKLPSIVYCAPGVYDVFSYRYDTHNAVITQLPGGVPKILKVWDRVTDVSKRVTIRVAPADTLATKTYTATSGYTDIYQAVLTVTGVAAPHRVLRNDLQDAYGFPVRMMRCTSVANLSAQPQGWYWDSATKIIYIKLGSGQAIDDHKSALEALWLDAAGNSRILCYGAVLLIDGDFYLKGVDRTPQEFTERGECWVRGVTSFAAASGASRVDGGWCVSEGERGHASNSDHLNGNPRGAYGGLLVTHRAYITYSGDPLSNQLLPAVDSNRNAISAHGGCDHISVGTVGVSSYGPVFADTSAAGKPAATWLVGCVARNSLSSLDTGNVGVGYLMQGINGSTSDTGIRQVWMDGCVAENNPAGLVNSYGAVVHVTGCSLGSITGSVVSYSPASP